MKRTLIAVFTIFGIFELIAFAGAAVYQPMQLGYIDFLYSTQTAAGIASTVPKGPGQPVWCTDCSTNGGAGTQCVSTGTGRGAFVISTGTICR